MPGMTTTPRGSGYPGYSETMTRTPETAEKARRLARVALCAWNMDDAGDSAALLLTELFANAVRHARGECVRVIIDRPDDDRCRRTRERPHPRTDERPQFLMP